MGVTGATGSLNSALPELIKKVKIASGNKPVAVGFGVSTHAHFKLVGSQAEGVVIGSQIVTTIKNAPGNEALAIRKYLYEVLGRSDLGNGSANGEYVVIANGENRAMDGEAVHVDAVIREGEHGTEPGLADQLEQLNMEDPPNPEVCTTLRVDIYALIDNGIDSAIQNWRVWRTICSRELDGLSCGA